MSTTDLTLHSEDGKEATGSGELKLHSQTKRTVLAAVYGVIGVGLGIPTFIPGPHMCFTWMFPVGGIYMALRTFSTEAELESFKGTCPACEESLDLPGGVLSTEGTMQAICRKCQAKLEVRVPLPEAPAEDAPAEA